MKRRALGATLWVALISALTGSLAWGSNPHGTPPGQTAKEQSSASVAASASASVSDSASANGGASASATTKMTPGGWKFDNSAGTPNATSSPGVKPSNDTDKWTCATAGSNQTKEYGNGSTAGQGVMHR